jgi:predicted Fe-Mo cluster-binding NifX family protein
MSESIAICQLKDRVAPRFDQCPEILLATINDTGVIQEKKIIATEALRPREIVPLLKRHQVSTIICGGVKEAGQKDLKRYNIRLLDNIIGDVDDVLALYIQGKLRSGNTKGLDD